MNILFMHVKYITFTICSFIILILSPIQNLQAQQLEEIMVTAQRREQSLQEVPVSVDVYLGAQLMEQGFNTLEDLSSFSPSVELEMDVIRMSVSVRGIGSNGPNLGLEQSAATFVDGVHFGRGSMSNGAYMDLERIEVLRGPQPVHFGQNATAGAFSLTTKKPTAEWQGDVTGEVGNLGRKKVEGGIGGPITDTFGIRVAGKIGRYTGHLTDVVSGAKFPHRDDDAARITLQWAPTDAFTASFSAAFQEVNTGGDAKVFCRSLGDPDLDEFATFVPGLVPAWDAVKKITPLPDCVKTGFTRLGRQEGDGQPFRPVVGISQSDQQFGYVDLIDLWPGEFPENPDLKARLHMNAKNYRLGLNYEFDNGIMVESITGNVDYFRQSFEDTSAAPIMANAANRTERFDMWSQELRVRSVAGGAIEWEAGGYYQREDLDGDPSCESRNGVRHPIRCNYLWQDSKWANAFASVTFNFMDDKASIDIGARYNTVDKTARIYGSSKTLIFDIDPDLNDAGGLDGTVESDGGSRDVTKFIIDCGDPTDTRLRQCGTFGMGFWTHTYGDRSPRKKRNRRLPDAWHLMKPVAFGPEIFGLRSREGEDENGDPVYGFFDSYSTNSLDPQVVLRYRPTPNMSVYAKWVRAFKSGGFDTASRSIPDSQDKFTFGDEDAENFELGIKGSLLDNRMRYAATAFRMRIKGLQQETNDPQGGSDITQAGLQETIGIEFNTSWAATERLTASLNGALMDGTLINFPDAGCTDQEDELADVTDCISLAESIALVGDDSREGFIDRSGFPSPRTPDWKFALELDYWVPLPLLDNVKGIYNVHIGVSDGYIHDVEGYSEVTKWPTHTNLNINTGIADLDDTWRVTFYARNLLNARVKYFPENDVLIPQGVEDQGKSNTMGQSQYFSFGLQLGYNFN